jgi:hypothetical protein
MPYIHWEADHAQLKVTATIEAVKAESQKTSGAPKNKLWPNEKDRNFTRHHSSPAIHLGQFGLSRLKSADVEQGVLDSPEAVEDYYELLRRYLFKRRPVHLRRTLDQYYYSHLADTNFRDGDQVVMRQLNSNTKNLKLKDDPKYQRLLDIKEEEEEIAKAGFLPRTIRKISTSRPMKLKEVNSQLLKIEQTPYRDGNSPILMVDQLWLWVIDESLLCIA